jgi:hypothetical protein
MLVTTTIWLLAALPGPAVECATIPDTAQVQALGAFSDMRYTDEHAYGYSVELWRAGRCVFGLFAASEGLAGDTPTGELTSVRYDPRTGRLGFSAKLTMGVTTEKGSTAPVPSRDLFVFTGYLSNKVLRGQLRQSNRLRPDLTAVQRDVILARSPEQEDFILEAHTYGEWRKKTESILRFRGPKW